MKHFTSVHDVTDIDALIAKALQYRSAPLCDKHLGINKRIGLVFLNPSMRTRISTQIAAQHLGMEAIILNIDKDGWKLELNDEAVMNGTTVEHIIDAARVFGSYFDILGVRTFPALRSKEEDYAEQMLNQLINNAGIPIVSLESATLHPLQSLADIITISEQFKERRKPKVVLTWAPHIKPIPHCVPNSFAQWLNAWGQADLTITHPPGYELDTSYTHGAEIEYDQAKALKDADFIYVKNWSTVTDYGQVKCNDSNWMPTIAHLQHTNNAKLMHCLPVRRNVELSSALLDSDHAIVTTQAANRVWAAQAVLSEILNAMK